MSKYKKKTYKRVKKPTIKQITFFNNFFDPDSPTHSDLDASYKAAGYRASTALHKNAVKLLNSDIIRKLVEEQKEKMFKSSLNRSETEREHILRQINEIYQDCWQTIDGTFRCIDRSNALKCLELKGKAIALWVERQIVDLPTAKEIAGALRIELTEIAKLRCLLPGQESDNEQPAKVIESTIIESDHVSTNQDSEIVSTNDNSEIPMPDFLNAD